MMYDSKVTVSKNTPMAFMKDAKNIAKSIKKKIDGEDSAFNCMELETESAYQVTTYKSGMPIIHNCVFQRITPLQVEVETQMYGTAQLKVSWLAEGVLDNKCCISKMTAYATWQNDWYMWDGSNNNGTPYAPYAEIYPKL